MTNVLRMYDAPGWIAPAPSLIRENTYGFGYGLLSLPRGEGRTITSSRCPIRLCTAHGDAWWLLQRLRVFDG
jgi:hypothetical protein